MAVPIEAKSRKPAAQAIDHFEPSLAEGITRFFVVYNEFQGKKFKLFGPPVRTTRWN